MWSTPAHKRNQCGGHAVSWARLEGDETTERQRLDPTESPRKGLDLILRATP